MASFTSFLLTTAMSLAASLSSCDVMHGLIPAPAGNPHDLQIYDSSLATAPFALRLAVNEGARAQLHVQTCVANTDCTTFFKMKCNEYFRKCQVSDVKSDFPYKFDWNYDPRGFQSMKMVATKALSWDSFPVQTLNDRMKFRARLEPANGGAKPGEWYLVR